MKSSSKRHVFLWALRLGASMWDWGIRLSRFINGYINLLFQDDRYLTLVVAMAYGGNGDYFVSCDSNGKKKPIPYCKNFPVAIVTWEL